MDEGGEVEAGQNSGHRKELRYFAHVTEGEGHAEVRAAAKDELPVTYFNLVRTQISVPRRVTFDTVFEVIIEYKHPSQSKWKPTDAGDTRVSIRSDSGASVNMKFSRNAVRLTPENKDPIQLPAAYHRVIGLQADGSVQGVDVDGNAIVVIVDSIIDGSIVNQKYLLDAASAKGKVNSFPYKGFPRGTLRMIQFDAQQQQQVESGDYVPDWQVQFAFHFEPNIRSTLPMASLSDDPDTPPSFVDVPYYKEGHHYLDLFQQGVKIESADIEYAYPVTLWATIHEIYEYVDFTSVLRV